MMKFHYSDEVNQNILLVKAVEREPEVYDHTLPGYNNRETQEQAWQRVADTVGDTVPMCRNRWMSLRGSMCRHIRQSMAAGPGTLKKPYYMAKHMAFLIPFTKVRALQTFGEKPKSNKQFSSFDYPCDDPSDDTERNGDDCGSPNFECTNIKPEIDSLQFDETDVDQFCSDTPALKKLKIDGNLATSSNTHETSFELKNNLAHLEASLEEDSSTDVQKRNSKKNQDTDTKCATRLNNDGFPSFSNNDDSLSCGYEDIAQMVIHHENRNPNVTPKGVFKNQDPDLSFLISLLPDMKKMSDKNKSEFKISVLQTIHGLVYNS